MIIRLKNFHAHSLHCSIIEGYINGAFQIIHKTEVISEETKCIHKGDECHEFLLKW